MKNKDSFLNDNITRKDGKLTAKHRSIETIYVTVQKLVYEPYLIFDYGWYIYEGKEEWRYTNGRKFVTPITREINTNKEYAGWHTNGKRYTMKEYVELHNFEFKYGVELQAGNIKFTLEKPMHYVSQYIRTPYCGSTVGRYIHLYFENDVWNIKVFTQIRSNESYEEILKPTFTTLENALEFITFHKAWCLK